MNERKKIISIIHEIYLNFIAVIHTLFYCFIYKKNKQTKDFYFFLFLYLLVRY